MSVSSKSQLRDYLVTVKPKYPVAGIAESEILTIPACTANEAVKQARHELRLSGWTKQVGPINYRAKLSKPRL